MTLEHYWMLLLFDQNRRYGVVVGFNQGPVSFNSLLAEDDSTWRIGSLIKLDLCELNKVCYFWGLGCGNWIFHILERILLVISSGLRGSGTKILIKNEFSSNFKRIFGITGCICVLLWIIRHWSVPIVVVYLNIYAHPNDDNNKKIINLNQLEINFIRFQTQSHEAWGYGPTASLNLNFKNR